MAGLGGNAAISFPLGGDELVFSAQPWIVNLSPAPGATHAGLIEPVRFTTRDVESAVDLGTVHIALGYAHVFSHGHELFDALPRTSRWGMSADPIVGDPEIDLVDDGVRIVKTSMYPQRSIYYTPIDVGTQPAPSALLALTIRPEVVNRVETPAGPLNQWVFPGIMPPPYGNIYIYQVGAVMGLEHGPRNTGVYVNFVNMGTMQSPIGAIRISGPQGSDGQYHPDFAFNFNWYGLRRYYLLWSEGTGTVEFFADQSGGSIKLAEAQINDFCQYGPAGPTRHGGPADISAVYGLDGWSGSRVVIRDMAIATDVGFPVIGGRRPGNYLTNEQAHGLVRTSGKQDPRRQAPGAWFDAPATILANPDPAEVKKVTRAGAFRITKVTPNTTAAIYRDDPGLRRAATFLGAGGVPVIGHDGFSFESTFYAIEGVLADAATGMGFLLYDGASVYDLALLDDSKTRTLGLLRRGGDPTKLAHHYLPNQPIDWSQPVSFRFTVDALRDKLEIYATDRVTPALSFPLGDRSFLPTGSDYNVERLLPFLLFGHHHAIKTVGSFELHQLDYCHSYQAWEARTETNPTTANPAWAKTGAGTATPATTGLRLQCAPGELLKYTRVANFDSSRGIILEAALAVQQAQEAVRSGLYLVIDDGAYAYMLSFVASQAGRFVAFSQRAGYESFAEQVGFDGLAAKLSAPLDWTKKHLYRFERRPREGLYLFVDGETTPRLAIPDTLHVGYPESIYLTPTVGFGQFSLEGSQSEWYCARTYCTSGYEFSTIKNEPTAQLEEDLFGAEAIVVAHMTDED